MLSEVLPGLQSSDWCISYTLSGATWEPPRFKEVLIFRLHKFNTKPAMAGHLTHESRKGKPHKILDTHMARVRVVPW